LLHLNKCSDLTLEVKSVKVKFFATIRDITKSKSIDFEYFETVDTLLHKLCNKYGDALTKKVFNGSELSNEIIILVNGRHIVHLDGINTKLSENDEISIFPVIAGG
jgi:sulfur-carrier protein